jgi:hypothetical protein
MRVKWTSPALSSLNAYFAYLGVAPLAASLALLALAACEPRRGAALDELMPCAELVLPAGEFAANECRLEANGEALRVKFAQGDAGAVAGNVSLEVIDAHGDVRQVMVEPGVSQYLAPRVDDVDGDGRADLLVGRDVGNVNTVSGVWIFSGERGVYERVGEINGIAVIHTEEGYVAVASRSSASVWDVAFYRLDQSGLQLVASVNVEGLERADGVVVTRCRLGDAPGIAALDLAPADARAKFCAEPAAVGVLGP